MKAEHLGVWMNALRVGTLTRQSNGAMGFAYDEGWLANTGLGRPVSLSMPLRNKPYTGAVVYNFFDNLLPDNGEIRSRIQARFHADTSHPFDLLSSIGMDCVGAIQLTHGDIDPREVKQISSSPLSDEEIGGVLRSYREAPLGMVEDDGGFRISIAGAQEKTALLRRGNQWHRPHGTTPTTHIFKLPIGEIKERGIDLTDSCENEWLCLTLADAFGIPACRSEVLTFDGAKALVVERFDRRLVADGSWIVRLPQEDMCQALGVAPGLKYEKDGGPGIKEIMNKLSASRLARQDQENFMRAQVLFWLLAGIDGHAKNFSLFIEHGGSFRLTPLYDVMSALPLIASRQLEANKIKMAMALQGKNRHYRWKDIQPRHFPSTAKHAGFSQKSTVTLFNQMIEQVDEVIKRVEPLIPADFPDRVATPILQGLKNRRTRP